MKSALKGPAEKGPKESASANKGGDKSNGSGKSKVTSSSSAPFVKGGGKKMVGFTGTSEAKPGVSHVEAKGKKGFSPAKGGSGKMAGFTGSGAAKPGVSEAKGTPKRGPAHGKG